MILWISISEASNLHDHFQVVASYDDYVIAVGQTEESLGSKNFLGLVTTPKSFRNGGGVIVDIFGQAPAVALLNALPTVSGEKVTGNIQDQLQAKLVGHSFDSVARLLAGVLQKQFAQVTPDLVKRSFFEWTAINVHDRDSYMTMGWTVRKTVNEILYQSPEGILPLFKALFQRTPLQDRRIISLETNFTSFTEPEQSSQLKALRLLASSYGTKLEWYAGIKRSFLTTMADADFEAQLSIIQRLVKDKAIAGIDITGSIKEDLPKEMTLSPEVIKLAQARFVALYKALSNPNFGTAKLRIHSFEAGNDGDFYKVLYGGLDSIKPGSNGAAADIHIGHIAHLTPNDIQRLKQVSDRNGINFFFEVNIYSNKELQKMPLKDLVYTVNLLAEYNMNFGLGADGAGIFGPQAQLTDMVKTLKKNGLSEKALQIILMNSGTSPSQNHTALDLYH